MTAAVSYASGASDQPLLGMSTAALFDDIVRQHGEREAVVSLHQDLRLSYSELAERVNSLAKAFIASGFNKGDRVGIWSPNSVEWLTTQYATAKAGLILVTVNPAYRVHELAYVLEQSGCRGLVLQNQFKTSDYQAMIVELCPELQSSEPGSLKSKKFAPLTTVISMTESEVPGISNWQDFLALANASSDAALAERRTKH